jgi:hypothetical protein
MHLESGIIDCMGVGIATVFDGAQTGNANRMKIYINGVFFLAIMLIFETASFLFFT